MSLTAPPPLSATRAARLRALVTRLRPWFSPLSFLGGFVFDVVTLRRIDDLRSNVRLSALLLVAAGLLVLERRAWHGRRVPGLAVRHPWLVRYGLQFCFGGLFSAYLVFYSRSATMGPSVAFCLVLAGLMLANELWFTRLRPDGPQVAMWFFCALSYLLFAIPTWTGALNDGARLAAAGLALTLSACLVVAIHLGRVVTAGVPSPPLRTALTQHLAAWFSLLGLLVGMVQIGAVPPVPLALSEAGVFHSLTVEGGVWEATYDPPPWWAPWRRDDQVFQLHRGESVTCFTSVFAPNGADLGVDHAWEHKDADGHWVEVQRIPWQMHGGRDGGWRSWTVKHNVAPGEWRVRVESDEGWEIGRVNFVVEPVAGPPPKRLTRRL